MHVVGLAMLNVPVSEAASYALVAVSTALFVIVVIGGLVVGISAWLTRAMRNHGVIDEERALRFWRVRSVVLTVVGLLAMLTPVQPIVTGQGLNAGGAGILAAGVAMTAGGVVWNSYLSSRLARIR